ncbi:hypothetical protein TD95_001869 [Thielaviopsis punctulata]|uniref:Trimethylguanosine synthase n=1 Tax=Thielaviopsis punctulata TaxID=72032 RepID=A0A0F4ZDT9_9PEZI|nr:hypothetical protein TD95_001869 [Thielaviopsis punctulata]
MPGSDRIAADMLSYPPSKTTIIDCFGGIGGNSIAFALSGRWHTIISIERDASTLACAQRNAALYGVAHAITFVLGDSFAVLQLARTRPERLPKELRVAPGNTVLFASPPWGGPGYVDDEVFDLSGMQPYNLADLHAAYREYEHALFLPRTSDIRQIAAVVPGEEKADVIQYCIHGASKALVAYIPAAESS